MDWLTIQNTSNPMSNPSGQRMPVWFMPMVFGVALLVVVVVVLVMCIRWRQMRSSADAWQEEEEEGYEEITAKKSSRNWKRNTDQDDYETIPVMTSKKKDKKTNKSNDGEYKMLTSVRPQHEREYAHLNKATCSSKTSLSSLTSARDVKEDRAKDRTKRQGLIIPSLSNPREETADKVCLSQARSLDDIASQSAKQVKQVNTSTSQPRSEITNLGVHQQKSRNLTRSATTRPKPGTFPKPCLTNIPRKNKNVRKIQYENATVFIDGDQTETRRIALEKGR